MLNNWDVIRKDLNLFKINERWGIRDNSINNTPSVIIHRCDTGMLGNVHDLIRNDYKCESCCTPVPDEIQALWLLRTCNTTDKHWMKERSDDDKG